MSVVHRWKRLQEIHDQHKYSFYSDDDDDYDDDDDDDDDDVVVVDNDVESF